MNFLLRQDFTNSTMRLLPILTIIALVLTFASMVHAQGLDQVDTNYTPVYQNSGNLTTYQQSTNLGNFFAGFDWKWLLPLLLVPLGVLILKWEQAEEDDYKPRWEGYGYQVVYHDIDRDLVKDSTKRWKNNSKKSKKK
jgi:hypothetical protein